MNITLKSILTLLVSFLIYGSHAFGQCFILELLPDGWQDMEIEAKWASNEQTYNTIVNAFPDGSTFDGIYTVNVRWSGVSRKYVDYYYDDNNNTLMNNKHSIRWRRRYSSNATNNNLSTLINANWQLNWEKVQYKSTPYRYGAIWFRNETGDCELATECACHNYINILNQSCSHPSTDALDDEHSNYNYSSVGKISEVVDYRYRIELQYFGQPVYEISLDRIVDANNNVEYEVELEIVKDNFTTADLSELFRLVELLQNNSNYSLTPSIESKGGIPLEEDNWDITLSNPIVINSSNDYNAGNKFKARHTLTTADVTVNSSGTAEFISGNNIFLAGSFHAKAGSSVKIRIADCSDDHMIKRDVIVSNDNFSEEPSIESVPKLLISPNPTYGELNFVFEGIDDISADSKIVVEIYNQMGELLLTDISEGVDKHINVNSLSAGIYNVRVVVDDANVFQSDFIKL